MFFQNNTKYEAISFKFDKAPARSIDMIFHK